MTTTIDISTLAGLIGSRICHDLASPVGAITNGLELLELSGAPATPETDLVAQSVAQAHARLRLFRLAFGHGSAEQGIGGDEVAGILRAHYASGRTRCAGFPAGAFPRAQIRLVLLAALCVEQALPQGGEITITRAEDGWCVAATGPRVTAAQAPWTALTGSTADMDATPSSVQFLLLPMLAAEGNMKIGFQASDTDVKIRLSPASCHPRRQDI